MSLFNRYKLIDLLVFLDVVQSWGNVLRTLFSSIKLLLHLMVKNGTATTTNRGPMGQKILQPDDVLD